MRKIRWKARFAGGLIALTGLGLAGCKHQLFLEPADWKEATRPNIPTALETDPYGPILPPNEPPDAKPATVSDSARPTRLLTLKEAFAIAIEQGNTGNGINGNDNPSLSRFTGRGTTGTDTIKAFVLDPAIAQAEVERSLSKFDARWSTSMTWSKQDQATLSLQQSFSNGDSATLTSTLAKPLPTGGMAGITTSMNYLNLASAPTNSQFIALTTSYTPRVQFIFEQPLMQGFGIEANQLLGAHPGSLLIPGLRPSGGQGSEGILVTRVRTAQARLQFDAQINDMLISVETAYWNLYSAYYSKYAQEVGLSQSFDLYSKLKDRTDKGVGAPYLKAQAAGQYYFFRVQVLTAKQQVLEADRVLRNLLGMRSDGTLFVPADAPAKGRYSPDINVVKKEALENRPEVLIARQEIKARQLDLLNQKNLRMADVRLFGSYDVNALGRGLTGGAPDNALSNLRLNQFNSWQVGVRVDIPIGFRDANALVRQSQLSLWKGYYQLTDSERKVHEGLVEAFRLMDVGYETNVFNEARRKFLTDVVQQQEARLGAITQEDFIGQLNALIQSQRDLATAISDQYRGLANYNTGLARLEYVKGTIQAYNNISVADGPLPAFVQKKAADHFRALDSAINLREHPAEILGGTAPTATDPFQPSPAVPMGTQPMPAAPGSNLPGLLPAPVSTPKGLPGGDQPTASSTKSWDNWQTPPTTLTPVPTATDGSGTFKQNGSVTLPKRPTPGTAQSEPPLIPALPTLSSPTTPILQIPAR